MDQLKISVDDQLAAYLRVQIASGRYNNVSEVVCEALRRMEAKDLVTDLLENEGTEDPHANLSDAELADLRLKIAEGDAQIERGEYTEYESIDDLRKLADEIKAEGRAKLLQRKAG